VLGDRLRLLLVAGLHRLAPLLLHPLHLLLERLFILPHLLHLLANRMRPAVLMGFGGGCGFFLGENRRND
jgi:hypothetical protein